MEEVTKSTFKKVFFRYGKASDGWGIEYWERTFEHSKSEDMKFLVRLPASDKESRMMIVTDYSNNEHRLFFLTEDQEEDFFRDE